MDYNVAGQSVRIDTRETEEARVNATGITITVSETGRLLEGLRFTVGSSLLVVDDGGVVTRSNFSFFNPVVAVTGSAGSDSVINNGAINGKIELGDGDDSYTATKSSDGGMDMGAGNDLVRLIGPTSIGFGTVDGGAGDDRLELVNSSIASSATQFRNFETIVLDGASEAGTSGLRITNLWTLQGVRNLAIIGDAGVIDPFTNSPQFYIRDTDQASLDVSLEGYATLYLDNSSLGSVTGDEGRNNLILWNDSNVLGVDLGAGDDLLSFTLASGKTGSLSWPMSLDGGTGNDSLSINFDSGGNISLDLRNVTGFESVGLGANRSTPGSMLVTGLADLPRLLIGGPISISLQNIVAPAMVIEFNSMNALTITAGSVVGRVGRELGTFGNNTPNPLITWLVQNDGEIRGTLRLEEGDDRYDGRAGLITGAVDGGAGNDELIGGAGAEDLRGGLGADRLEGNAGDDRLTGGGGGDTLLGGSGSDTAVLSGGRRDYEVTRNGETVTVRDLRPSADGTDTLSGIERLEFSDGLMGLIPEELLLFLPGTRDLIAWDPGKGPNGFKSFLGVDSFSQPIATSDFTGDGRSDVLFQRADGGFLLWDVAKAGTGFKFLPPSPGFTMVGLGDLRGDAAADILLQGPDRTLRMLDVAAGTVTHLMTLAPGWTVKGVANINGTGKADVIFKQDGSGVLVSLTENGWTNLFTLASGWDIVGFGDVTGGLADDFVLMNGSSRTALFWDATRGGLGWENFANITPGWTISGFHDLTGDGRDDVVIRSDNGLAIYWTGSDWGSLGNVLAGAEIVGSGVFP